MRARRGSPTAQRSPLRTGYPPSIRQAPSNAEITGRRSSLERSGDRFAVNQCTGSETLAQRSIAPLDRATSGSKLPDEALELFR
jgi:hypothetical protein